MSDGPDAPARGDPPTWVPRRDPFAWVIVPIYLALAIATSYIHELGYAADETSRHLPYVEWLAHEWRLPPNDPTAEAGPLELHPPLYYLALTPVYLAAEPFGRRAALRALRWTSPFLVGLALLWWFGVIRRACREDRRTTLFTFALTAWWPNLFADASMLTNDVGALLASSALLYLVAVRGWESRRIRSAALWGLVIGIGGLAKASVPVATVPVVVVALVWQHGRRFWGDRRFWARLVACGAVCVLVCGWWYVRSEMLQGSLTGITTRLGYAPIPPGMGLAEAWSSGLVALLLWRAIQGMWMSVFTGVVWLPPWSRPTAYGGLLLLTLAATLGIVLRLRRRSPDAPLNGSRLPAIILPAVGFGAILLADIYVSVFVHAGFYQGGRYLLPFLPGLTIPLALGLRRVIPQRVLTGAFGAVLVFWLVLTFLAWYYVYTHWNPYVLSTAGPFR